MSISCHRCFPGPCAQRCQFDLTGSAAALPEVPPPSPAVDPVDRLLQFMVEQRDARTALERRVEQLEARLAGLEGRG
jgi:hypothetical protein